MPAYVFRLPARAAGRSVNVYTDAGILHPSGPGTMTVSSQDVTLAAPISSGTTAGDGTYTVPLPVGDYTAVVVSMSNPNIWHVAPEELLSPSTAEDLSMDGLRAALEPHVDRTGATTGQVPTLQPDGSLAFAAATGGFTPQQAAGVAAGMALVFGA